MKDKIKQYVKTSIIVTMAVLGVTSCNNQNNTSFDTSKRITVVTRDDGSGTKSAFMEIIGLKGKKDPAGVISASSTTTVLATVKTNPLAIAYESLGYVTDEVKILKVDQVDCNVENIKTGDYKIARSLNIVYKETILQNPVFEDFYKFLGSSDSQKIISDNGYVSTKDDISSYVKENDFKNLIENAVRYNYDNGKINIDIKDQGQKVVFEVRDTGIGIAKEDQKRIFERFYRVEKSRSRQTGGTGLGLAIVKHICILYGADIKIDSSLGKGTIITVIFEK